LEQRLGLALGQWGLAVVGPVSHLGEQVLGGLGERGLTFADRGRQRRVARLHQVSGHLPKRPRFASVVDLQHERLGLLAQPKLGGDERQAIHVAPLASRRAGRPLADAGGRQLVPPVLLATGLEVGRVADLVDDVATILEHARAAAVGAGLDDIAQHQDRGAIGPAGEVQDRGESDGRFRAVALADAFRAGVDRVDDHQVVGVERERAPRGGIGERRGLVAGDDLEVRRVVATPLFQTPADFMARVVAVNEEHPQPHAGEAHGDRVGDLGLAQPARRVQLRDSAAHEKAWLEEVHRLVGFLQEHRHGDGAAPHAVEAAGQRRVRRGRPGSARVPVGERAQCLADRLPVGAALSSI
jgi:hypothetical protein